MASPLRVSVASLAALVACTPHREPPPAQTQAATSPTSPTPAPPEPQPAAVATPVTPDEPAPPEPEPPADDSPDDSADEAPAAPPTPRPVPRGSKRCSFKSFTDTPTRALAAALRHWIVPAAFTCPATFRLVQRRPWRDDFEFGALAAAHERELYTFVGVDESSGDVLSMTLGRSDERGFHGSGCGVPDGFRSGWYCVDAASRDRDDPEPLRTWLAARPGQLHALDWIALELPVFEVDDLEWRSQARVLHVHEDRDVTLCWQRGGSARCWRLPDVDHSELEDAGGYSDDVGLVTKTGSTRRRWRLTASGGLRGRGLAAWQKIDATILATPALDPARALHTVGDGALALGAYREIGHGGVDAVLSAEWILTRDGSDWTATPLPDAVVEEVIVAGDSLAVVTADIHIGDGPFHHEKQLLLLAPGPSGPTYAGQLEDLVGEHMVSEGGTYTWRYAITSPAPDCVRLAPGEVSGFLLEHTEDEREIAKKLRPADVFGKLDGDWSITRDGPRRGCPATL